MSIDLTGQVVRLDGAAPLLTVEGLGVTFGGLAAVSDVSFEVPSGQLVGVIGANGAGKTTMFDAISGLVPHHGRVTVAGVPVDGLPPQMRARAGLGRSFQDARLFPGLTVRETVSLALQRHAEDPGMCAELMAWPGAVMRERRLREQAQQAVHLFGLDAWADTFISELSTGTRRIVDLACVYAQQPRVILLDEPSSGIAQREVEALGEVILRLRELAGATLLLVEHDVPLVRRIANRVLVMESGRLIADGPPATVLELPAVIASYLGTDERALQRSGVSAAALVEVAELPAEERTDETQPALAGLPARDQFRVPFRQVGEMAMAAAAALVVAAVAFQSPALETAAQHLAPNRAPAVAGSAPPAGPPAAPPAIPLPNAPAVTTPIVFPTPDTGVVVVPPDTGSTSTPTPKPTPTPTPCPAQQLQPLCDVLPLPALPVTPLAGLPLQASSPGYSWVHAATGGPWVQLPAGWPVTAWGATESVPAAGDSGTLMAWGLTPAKLWSQMSVSWWRSTTAPSRSTASGPLPLTLEQTEWLQSTCDGTHCYLFVAISAPRGGGAGPTQLAVAAASLRPS
ncbi:MAG: ABC transporter ATP-binding protein [Chloroflexi bacterium]|nr:MAG: ABC transporter ATP-binding protein [Chloroflexota bacterium]